MRLIDADALGIGKAKREVFNNPEYADGWNSAIDLVNNAPTVDASPAEPRWIPITTRPMDEEERAYYAETLSWELTDDEAVVFTCEMPEDGQDVWVCSKCGNVWQDTCCIDEGIGLEGNGDWDDIVAWMPFTKPTPWKGESDVRSMPL